MTTGLASFAENLDAMVKQVVDNEQRDPIGAENRLSAIYMATVGATFPREDLELYLTVAIARLATLELTS